VTRSYLSLGSNLGDRRAALVAAIEALDWGTVTVVARSSVYETEPVDAPEGSPGFLNQVVAVDSELDARELWERCSAVEVALGRSRDLTVRNAPRTIDIDLLLHGDAVLDEPDLIVPHPRMAERAFVLVPLAEIAPDAVVPGAGRVADLAARVERSGVSLAG